jgi:hypothetical protein
MDYPLPKLDYSNMGIITRMQVISYHTLMLDPTAGKNWRYDHHGRNDRVRTCEQKRFGRVQHIPRFPSGLLSLGYREYPRQHNQRIGNQR